MTHAHGSVLEVRDVHVSFGGVKAVDGCAFEVAEGTITAVIGPNGAGKSTMVNIIAGVLRPSAGLVHFESVAIAGMPSYRIGRLGLIRTFQLSREFGGLTVLENLLVPPPGQRGEKLWNALVRPGVGRREDRTLVAKAQDVLDTFGLSGQRDEYARNLSGGQKRLLELARAVMAEPKFLMLDEPMAGINPALVGQLCSHMFRLRDQGMTLMIVEHNLAVVEELCDHVIVMSEGRTLATGGMSELRANDAVVRAYLGSSVHAAR